MGTELLTLEEIISRTSDDLWDMNTSMLHFPTFKYQLAKEEALAIVRELRKRLDSPPDYFLIDVREMRGDRFLFTRVAYRSTPQAGMSSEERTFIRSIEKAHNMEHQPTEIGFARFYVVDSKSKDAQKFKDGNIFLPDTDRCILVMNLTDPSPTKDKVILVMNAFYSAYTAIRTSSRTSTNYSVGSK